ncbi:MAG: hypothetical protein JXM73_21325 [Anaerolineae bacterium]|nr:hypothetical protein [Anaerolineae bacterium]
MGRTSLRVLRVAHDERVDATPSRRLSTRCAPALQTLDLHVLVAGAAEERERREQECLCRAKEWPMAARK